ncbi:MAG TPA: hypothetical protein VFA07_17800 [Chthonomonadaceae bacterium]|nr:hypothetical protein [Chthonomonadaceae bacterium]
MPSASDTAYPLLKADPTDKELAEIYTPNESEMVIVANLLAFHTLVNMTQALALLGESWAAKQESLVLEAPSAIVESESNYLINPLHPSFPALHIEGPFPYEFDPRLMG